jgi:hypothetical protein
VPVLSWCALRRSTAHCPPTYSFRGRSMQFQKPACGPRLLQRPPSALASPKHLPSRPRSSAFALTPHVRLVNPSSLLPVEQSQSLASPWTPSHLLFRSCRRGRANPRCPSFDPCLGRSSWTFRCRLAPSRRRGDSVDQKNPFPLTSTTSNDSRLVQRRIVLPEPASSHSPNEDSDVAVHRSHASSPPPSPSSYF